MKSRAHGRRHADGGHGGSERWLITYADLITLLVAFFIMMYSLAQLDLAKFTKAMGGYRQSASSLGIMTGGDSILEGRTGVLDADAPASGERENVSPSEPGTDGLATGLVDLRRDIVRLGLTGAVSARLTEEGLVVSMAGPLLFDSGEADIKVEARPILGAVARVISANPKSVIRVEGHADSVPIHTLRFPSNWELSSARAAAVVRELMRSGVADGTRFIVVGYGDFRPVRPNTGPEGRAQNRRVEIVLLRSP